MNRNSCLFGGDMGALMSWGVATLTAASHAYAPDPASAVPNLVTNFAGASKGCSLPRSKHKPI